jgi:hypothetical protein
VRRGSVSILSRSPVSLSRVSGCSAPVTVTVTVSRVRSLQINIKLVAFFLLRKLISTGVLHYKKENRCGVAGVSESGAREEVLRRLQVALGV